MQNKIIQLPDVQANYPRLKEILSEQGYDLNEKYKTYFMTKQQVRLIDIFILSPFLIWASTQTQNSTAKYGLLLFAFTTMTYNAYNYIKEKE
jgi:hypothetical protein